MRRITVAIPYQEMVWGQIIVTANIPEGYDQETFVDAIQRGDIDVFVQDILPDENWEAQDSEVVDIDYANLEVIK